MLTRLLIALLVAFATYSSYAQQLSTQRLNRRTTVTLDTVSQKNAKVVVVTGARFSYELIQHLIDTYNTEYPDRQIIIEARGSKDPLQFDILSEVTDPTDEFIKDHDVYVIGRYAVLPVANGKSEFATAYKTSGLTNSLLTTVFFQNPFVNEEVKAVAKKQYTVYTRIQKAGAPTVFAKHYGFRQQDINGRGIAGSDEHLLKAILRDSNAVSYLPTPLIFNRLTGKTVDGLTLIPLDLDENGRVKQDELTSFTDLVSITDALEQERKQGTNAPVGTLHLSINKNNTAEEPRLFLQWVMENSHKYLHAFGYLLPATTSDHYVDNNILNK